MSDLLAGSSSSGSARLWRRYINVVLSGQQDFQTEISDLRVRFDIRQNDIQSPNTADVTIYNLSQDSANRFAKEFNQITIRAGYDRNRGVLFRGSIKQFRYGRESPTDTYLNIRAADGDIAYTQSRISVSLAAGATAEDALAAILQALAPYEITRGYIAPLPTTRTPRAQVLVGMVRDVLRVLSATWGVSWSIQSKRLTILPLSGAALPGEAIVLNGGSGMIGFPEQTLEGIMARSLLNPQFEPGATVNINNSSITKAQVDLSNRGEIRNALQREVRITEDGFYRIVAVDHFGDTHAEAWYSELACIALGEAIPVAQAQRGRL